tara:strand:- start:304 stop:528 length:225 start_codon:yes stop_codon:yes gene_type:complete
METLIMKHLRENNETYLGHFVFASTLGAMLILRGWLFVFHALLPICKIPERWNLSSTAKELIKCNEYAKGRMKK